MDVSNRGNDEFFEAIYHGDFLKVERLLLDGISANAINRSGETTLLYSALHGKVACVEALLRHGVTYDKLPMIEAAVSGDPAVVRLFLTMGGDPNVQDERGQTPLMEAADWGNIDVVKVLLASGANPSIKALNGATAIDIARSRGHTDVVFLLQQA